MPYSNPRLLNHQPLKKRKLPDLVPDQILVIRPGGCRLIMVAVVVVILAEVIPLVATTPLMVCNTTDITMYASKYISEYTLASIEVIPVYIMDNRE